MPNIIKKLTKSRKAFFVEYICGFFLLALAFWIWVNEISVPSQAYYGLVALGILVVLSPEVMRFSVRYTITENKIIIVKGIILHERKNVYYHPLAFVPDLNIKQSRIDRVLRIGSIYLKGGTENTFEMVGINNPHKILKILERLIDQNTKLKQMSDD